MKAESWFQLRVLGVTPQNKKGSSSCCSLFCHGASPLGGDPWGDCEAGSFTGAPWYARSADFTGPDVWRAEACNISAPTRALVRYPARALRLRPPKRERRQPLHRLHHRPPATSCRPPRRPGLLHTPSPPLQAHLLRGLSRRARRQSPRAVPKERFWQALHPPATCALPFGFESIIPRPSRGPRCCSSGDRSP